MGEDTLMAKQLILHCNPADAFYHPRLGLVICMELWEGDTLIRTLHVVAPCESDDEGLVDALAFGLMALVKQNPHLLRLTLKGGSQ